MLIDLIVDLSRDAELRRRFDENPEAVASKYDIPDEPRQALLARDSSRLETFLQSDATALLLKLVPSPHFYWPGNQLRLTSVAPSSGAVGATIALTAKGELFDENATLTFTRPGATVKVTDVQVKNVGVDSTLTGKAVFQDAGVYDATVQNPDSGDKSTLPQCFTAQ